ncbi:MAG: sulfate/molybdate ABC transporter ATP-binding protein [Eubacteriales bacterium]
MALIVDIEKRLGDFNLVSRFEADEETLAILGASGCGKSMTLKCIAGIETPDKGYIALDGRVLFDSQSKTNLAVRTRRIGYLFQDYALFPNMTVIKNIACGVPKALDKSQIVREMIDAFFLEGLENQYPPQLSGGQKQRVALARMLASQPDLLMLDEPFSALDSFLKWQLEQEILKLRDRFNGTMLFVSHNRDEVYRLCDRIAVMENGKTQEVLTKQDLYTNPQTLSTALLSGCKNISAAVRTGQNTLYAQSWDVHLTSQKTVPHDLTHVGFRAHFFALAESDGANTIPCRVVRLIDDMFSVILLCQPLKASTSENTLLRFEMDKAKWDALKEKDTLYFRMPEDQLILMR